MSRRIDEPAVLVIGTEVATALNMHSAGDKREVSDLSDEEFIKYSSVSSAIDILEENLRESAISRMEFKYGFNGKGIPIHKRDSLGLSNPQPREFKDCFLVYIRAYNKPRLFDKAYANFAALEDEFAMELKGLLPEGFLLRDHIYELSGTCD